MGNFKKPLNLRMNVNYGKPQYHSVKPEFITKKTGNSYVMGVTEALLEMSFRVKLFAVNGCAFIEELTVQYGYPTLHIYLNENYPQNSCPAKEILAHENEHVLVHQKMLKKFSPQIGQAVREVVGTLSPTSFRDQNELGDIANRYVKHIKNHPRFAIIQQQFEQRVRKQNHHLDRKENYLNIKKKCREW